MKGHTSFLVRCLALVVIIGLLLSVYFKVFTPKIYDYNEWATTSTYSGFYELQDNTVDVIFMGSSGGQSAFSPQQLYKEFGITSYNLSCEQQSFFTSYYWLMEALRFQKPKAVVIETSAFFENRPGGGEPEVLNSDEVCIRKPLDAMKWSKVKASAVDEVCDIDVQHNKLSYYLPNIRYHGRWSSLNYGDFHYNEVVKNTQLKGQNPLTMINTEEPFGPIVIDEAASPKPLMDIMVDYANRIDALCKENNILLIFVTTPTNIADSSMHNALLNYANEHDDAYIDCNEESVYTAMNYDASTDNAEASHINVFGAVKITDYIGGFIVDKLGIKAHSDIAWDEDMAFYDNVMDEALASVKANYGVGE